MKRFAALVGVLGLLAFVVPSAALASSTCQAYNPQLCSSVGSNNTSTGSGTGATSASSTGTLPFTGLDVVLLVAGGGTLLAAGFVVRRLSRRLNS
jgi:DICT domain-containing protein